MSQRRIYTREFKLEAVRQTEVAGVTLKQVAAELGLNAQMLGELGAFPGQGNARDEEVAALKRELACVKKERDFLKQAAAYFAKESK